MSTMSPNPKRLGDAIEARVADLWPDYNTAAEAIGISGETLAKARQGKKVSRKTLLRIESAIGWAAGSVDAILDGGEPRVAPREIARLPRLPGPSPAEEGEPQIHMRGVPPLREDEELSGWAPVNGWSVYLYAVHSVSPPLVYRVPMPEGLSVEEAVKRLRAATGVTGM